MKYPSKDKCIYYIVDYYNNVKTNKKILFNIATMTLTYNAYLVSIVRNLTICQIGMIEFRVQNIIT